MKVDISIGKSKWSKKWRNEVWTWNEIVDAVAEVKRTAETVKQYREMTNDEKDGVKDIGGFVGGSINRGRRLIVNIAFRSMVTLDLDAATPRFWRLFQMLYGCAACIYSTHSHTPRNPRLRLLIPLDRDLDHAEYEALVRKLADNLGMEQFDHTSFRVHQLMYWPSCPKDGEFIHDFQEGNALCADNILAEYDDWTDIREWPTSDKEKRLVEHSLKKQGDPLEKEGIIGAFCRAYNIHEAIDKFLPDVYDPLGDGRYSYAHGSTAGGLVTYDDVYAYSHHSTDPISGTLRNAFDLVRIHLFGLQDEDAREGTATTRLPSYKAMLDFVAKDGPTKRVVAKERRQESRSAFEGEGWEFDRPDEPDEEDKPRKAPAEDVGDDWTERLEMDRQGNYYSTADNITVILSYDPHFRGVLAFDAFQHQVVMLKNVPWRPVDKRYNGITDTDKAFIRHYLEKGYGISHVSKTEDAIDVVAHRNEIHPVRDYLEGLAWDQVPRLDYLLVNFLGAECTEYVQTVTRKALVAAVGRIMRPGCKYEYVLTLSGAEGSGKSELFARLGGLWFSDSFAGFAGKEAYEQLHGVWILEMGELAGLKRAEIEVAKHYIAKRYDRFRVSYGRQPQEFPRQNIFVGTTEDDEFLRNINGNRRWWPVKIGVTSPDKDVFKDFTREVRDQIWAEAYDLWREGERLYLDRDLEQKAKLVRQAHIEQDPREGMIARFLEVELPAGWPDMQVLERRAWLNGDDEMRAKGIEGRKRVCIAEIWCEALENNLRDLNSFKAKEIHYIMRSMAGWEYCGEKHITFGNLYGRQHYYRRK